MQTKKTTRYFYDLFRNNIVTEKLRIIFMMMKITKYYVKITLYKNGFEKKIITTTENITRDFFDLSHENPGVL